jgi:hypothetical protein
MLFAGLFAAVSARLLRRSSLFGYTPLMIGRTDSWRLLGLGLSRPWAFR